MQYFLAILIGSVFHIGSLYIAFIAYVLIFKLIHFNISFSRIQWQYITLGSVGAILSFIYIITNDAASSDPTILLSIRKNLIQIVFAIALYEFLKHKTLQYVLNIIYMSIIPNIIMGTYEISKTFPDRIHMLFPEPSAAGYYYLFVFFILLGNFSSNISFLTTRYFMLIGLAIGSKSQIILLSMVAVLKYSTPKKLFVLGMVVFIFIYIFKNDILAIEAVEYNLMVLNLYLDEGLAGLKLSNSVWGTYVTRISSIQGSLMCLVDNPLGVGFGGFNSWYVTNMANMGFESPETDAIIYGPLYASPKSNLLNYFVSTGIVGIFLYLSWFKSFLKFRKQKEYLFQSFIILSLASTFIELNPMYIYFMILFILKEKEELILSKEEKKNET